MLSEHEILELLERLKSNPDPTGRRHEDSLAHWPLLVASSLCLNLQHVADAEFARHPERISIAPGGGAGCDTMPLADICSDYRLVHHVDTGFDQCSLLVAYDTRCLQVLALLCGNDNLNGFSAASAYDFSLSLAECVEASSSSARRRSGGFLALEFESSMQCEAGWCLTISAGGISGSLYVGLVGMPPVSVANDAGEGKAQWLEIKLRPATISRSRQSGELAIVFSESSVLPLACQPTEIEPRSDRRIQSSVVHQSLRLSMADVYVLALEALGVGGMLTLHCDARCVSASALSSDSLSLEDGSRLPCVSLDFLPLRSGELTRRGDQLMFVGRD